MSILVVGTVAFDSVSTPLGSREEILGGSATFFSIAASYFSPVNLVAVVGEDFGDTDRAIFAKHRIDIEGLHAVPGRTFRWRGEYRGDLNTAHTLETQLNVLAGFRPELPARYLDSDYVFLANIDPDLQREVLDQVRSPRVVACDTMNFWIEGKRDALLKTLSRVDILVINDAEAKQLSGEGGLLTAVTAIHACGPETVVIKRGEHGVLMSTGKTLFAAPGFPLARPVDPTGAGDSFAGGFMGHLARSGNLGEVSLRQAVIYGSVMASYNVEDFSLGRLSSLTPDDISRRYRAFSDLTRFAELPAELG